MLKRTKSLLEHNSLRIAIASSLLIFVLSMMKMEGIPKLSYNHIDKIEHIIAYAFMSFFWMLSRQLEKIKFNLFYLILFLVGYGVLIEVLQMCLTVSRTGDLLDVLANSTGVFLGYIILILLRRL